MTTNGSNIPRRVSLRRIFFVMLTVLACVGACGGIGFYALFGQAFSRGISHLFSPTQMSQYRAEMDSRSQELGRLPSVVVDVLSDSDNIESTQQVSTTSSTAVVVSTVKVTETSTVKRLIRPTTPGSVEVAGFRSATLTANAPKPAATPTVPVSPTAEPTSQPSPTPEPLIVSNTSVSTPTPTNTTEPCVIAADTANPGTQDAVRNMSYVVIDTPGVIVRFWNGTTNQDVELPAGGTNLHTHLNIADHIQVVTIPYGTTIIGFENLGADGGSGSGDTWVYKCGD